jgi:hypothetical protein
MKELIVSNFELYYDGMYWIKSEGKDRRVYLGLNTILQMLEIEGYSTEQVDELIRSWKPLLFSKVKLVFTILKETPKYQFLLTSECSDNYLKEKIVLIDVKLKLD